VKKRFLTRRKAKTPFILAGLVILLGGYFGFQKAFKSQSEEIKEPIVLETWSRFSEMNRLGMLLKGFAISSIADVPCGNIDSLDLTSLPIEHYLGIVKGRDEAGALQTLFGSAKSSFMAFDPIIDVLPRVDLILCWDYLCTLSPLEIRAALLQFKKSGATFILMRHFPEVRKNEEKKPGVFQPINWKIPPYNFPEPIIHIMENGEHGMESLALWNLENLPS